MFGKLLKYELKSVRKWYLSLYGIALVLSSVVGVWLKYLESHSSDSILPTIVSILTFLSFGAVIASLLLSTLFLIVKRFKRNIYGRQGYLTLTLPVTTHQILISKLISAFIWFVLSALVTILSISFVAIFSENITFDFAELSRALSKILSYIDINVGIYLANAIVIVFFSILIIYVAIALGHLAEDHRTLLSFVAYFGVWILLFILDVLIINNLPNLDSYYLFQLIYRLILCTVAYLSTHYLIKYKLNIQ